MRALILYTVLVIIGTVIAVFIGLFVEREITDAGSVVVFLVLFFANFYVSWMITKAVVERTLKPSAADEATPST
jgi:multisubunit Na+/H+ antiporter MnhG subunit